MVHLGNHKLVEQGQQTSPMQILLRKFTAKSFLNCHKCRLHASVPYIHLFEKVWHEEHFCCHCCGDHLGNTYYNKDGEVYCKVCYANVSDDICYKCKTLVEGFGYVLNKSVYCYHAGCLQCGFCAKPISNLEKVYGFAAWGQIYCCRSHAARRCPSCKPNQVQLLFQRARGKRSCSCVAQMSLRKCINFQRQQTVFWYQRNILLPENNAEIAKLRSFHNG